MRFKIFSGTSNLRLNLHCAKIVCSLRLFFGTGLTICVKLY